MKQRFILFCLLLSASLFGQVITPFSIRYQVTQKGGIRYISNTAVTCSGGGCGAGRTEVPPAGTSTDNGFNAAYVDIDTDGSTFQSSADSIALPTCSQISWAGLYWGGEITNAAANYATRNQVRLKVNNGVYQNLTADNLQDNNVGFDTYHCFKNITSIVQAAGTNARFTLANVAARVGGTNRFGGWTIVVVYKNDLQPMRNLTVFNGLSNVSGSNPITDITVSGFLTPLSGPVTFEVGNVTYDGDRSSTGDQLMFNGGSGFVNISDAVNPLNDIFNSTYSYNGVQKVAPFINPGYTNSLGYDADIFIPNNAAKNYIGNSATSATLRLTTGGETFLTQVVTMAIDVYEPDLRAAVRAVDLNGGTVLPGDIIEYTVVGKNIGSDPAVNTFIVDSLEGNAVYVPGSLQITSGPNLGAKTDAAGDDQGEYIAASRTIRVRIGTGANGVSGGQVNNSSLGVDSTQFKFRVTATTDCIILACDNIINARAHIYGTGNVSGNTWSNGSNPDIFDVFGCPIPGTTTTPIQSTGCPSPSASSNTPVCTGSTITLSTAPSSVGSTYAWTGPGGFVSSSANPSRANATAAMAGTYTCVITPPNYACSFTVTTTVAINTTPATPSPSSNTPVCTGSTINLSTAAVAGATYSWTGPSAFTSSLQNPTRANATAAMTGTYSVTVTANGCTSATGTTAVVVNTTPATPSPSSNTPVCTGSTINLSTAAVPGATYSWTGPSAFASSLQNPTRANATAAMAGTYSVTVTANGCTSGVGTTAVVVNTTPATPSPSSNTPVCTGNTLNLSTAAVAGATYSWTGPNSFSSSLQNPSLASVNTFAAGTYSVTVTTNGCTSAVGTTAVVVNTTPATPSPSSNSPVCTGSTINLSTAAVPGATYSWTGPSAFASSVQNPTRANATAAMSGTYSVTVTANGCTSPIGTTAVVVNATPATPTASSNSPVCAGNAINLSTPAVVGASYSWTGPNSFTSSLQNPTILFTSTADAGTYSVTITVNGCVSGTGTTAVIVNATPAAPVASSNSPVCSGSALNLSTPAVAGATYLWVGPNGFTSSAQNPTIASPTTADAGAYDVVVTVAGCPSAPGTTVVVISSTPATPSPSSNTPVCTGSTLNLSTAAVSGATYSWTGPNGFTSSAQNPSIASVTAAEAGTYSVTVTANGCTSAMGTTAVAVNATPAAPSASGNSPVCSGNALNLSTPAVGGATYSWTGPNSFTSSVQNPSIASATTAATGTYSVTVTVAGCTSASGTTNVTVNATPATPVASSNSPVCSGNALNLSTPAVGGVTYSWTGPNSFTSSAQNPSIAPATTADAGTYSVTLTENGCTSAVGTVAVVVNATPATPSASSNSPVCSGNALNLSTPAVGGASYSWSGPNGFTASTQNPSIASAALADAGTYSVTVTLSGCTSAAGTTAVTVNATPATPSASSNSPVCSGNSLNLSTPAVGGATYSWTGPNSFTSSAQNPSIAPATTADAGTYSVTLTENGCTSAVGTVAVIVNATPATPSASSNSPVCSGNALNLSTPAVGGATYSWSGPNGFTASTENPSIASAALADAGTYSVTVTLGGCTSAAGTTAVTVNATPATPSASSNSPVCTGNPINLSTPAVSGATYSWTGPNSFTSSAQNPSIAAATLADDGTYSVTITAGGCTSAAGTTVVTVNSTLPAPAVSSNSPVCTGGSLTLSTPFVAGATYSWSGPNSFASTAQNPTLASVTTAEAGTYSLTITVSGCASAIGTSSVIINTTPAAPAVTASSPVCTGDSITLSTPAVPGATYNWSGPNGFVSSAQNPTITSITTAAAGTYSLSITENGCTSTDGTAGVIVNTTPAAPAVSASSPVCPGDSINLSTPAVTGATYSWSGPNGFTSTAQNPTISAVTISAAGTYSLSITESGCTSASGTATVVVNPTPATPAASGSSPHCPGDSIVLSTPFVAGATYSWSGPNGFASTAQNPVITSVTTAASGTYSVNITENGCTSADGTAIVVVNPTPAAPLASGNSPVCETTAITLFADTIANAVYAWTGPNGFSSSLQNPSLPNADSSMADTYYVTVSVNGCLSPSDSVTIVVQNCDDNDNDGVYDAADPDDDNDGTTDIAEGNGDTDGDGIPNGFDLDSDNDGITDVTEAGAPDTNGDGIIDGFADTDNDGLADSVDPDNGGTPLVSLDTDGDGIANMIDLDSDNDGIVDVREAGGADADGNGIVDNYVDTDGDGLADSVDPNNGGTPLPNTDSDGDLLSDCIDIDADNDGIVDNIEGQATIGYIVPSGNDSDGDGIDNAYDSFSGFGGAGITPVNTDATDAPDYLDGDSDNDGMSDVIEGNDFNNDNAPDVTATGNDADNDGLDDAYDNVNTSGVSNVTNNDAPNSVSFPDADVPGGELDWRQPLDTDNDGITNVDDIDDDNDGITDVTENATASNSGDTDHDGVPDQLDLDSDNDGIADVIEANGTDPDNDGIIGTGPITDANNDGLHDSVAPGLPGVDTDGDGHPDFQDLDADNDGINDIVESGGGQADANSDGVVDGPDTDGDGLPDATETTGLTGNPADFDGDNVDDYRDLDSDNDGVNDIVESGNGASDTDSDGVADGGDSDNDGIRDAVDANDNLFGDPDTNDTPGDFDGDGNPDHNDLDSDNDGVHDVEESGNATADLDSDGVVDGGDTDGDGIRDPVDANDNVFGDADANDDAPDTDNDGLPDYTDLDADNDGINDVEESGNGDLDLDDDGVVDGGDVDNDGILDPADSNDGVYGDPDANDSSADTDGDGTPDYQDLDADNDGINDLSESGNGPDANNDGMVDGNDSDNDGILDPADGSNGTYGDGPGNSDDATDTDGDGRPDYQDVDSDNDGVNDGIGDETPNEDCDGDGISNYLDADACDLIIPQGFSPNGDGVNDFFEIVGISAFTGNKVTIFNRWGNIVFDGTGYNNGTIRWDGTNSGELSLGQGPLPEGTYFYMIDLGDGSAVLSGYVYLNRQ